MLVSSELARLRRLMHDDGALHGVDGAVRPAERLDEEKAVGGGRRTALSGPPTCRWRRQGVRLVAGAASRDGGEDNVNAVTTWVRRCSGERGVQASLNVRTNAGLMKDREAADEYLAQMTATSATAASERVVAAAWANQVASALRAYVSHSTLGSSR
ncbi:MAG: hypothetical protein WKH64_03540 [Chloroflexia bacterium]